MASWCIPAPPSCAVSGTGHYIDLLSSSNIRWDLLAPAAISHDTFISGGIVKYAAAIFAVPFASLSDEQMAVIKDVAFEFGISIIAAYDLPDERSKGYFGVRAFRGRKTLWPLKVRISGWAHPAHTGEVVADFGLKAGFSGLRTRGFRKLSFKRTLAKAGRLLKNLPMPYMAADHDCDVAGTRDDDGRHACSLVAPVRSCHQLLLRPR